MSRGKMQPKDWFENWYSSKEKIFAWNIGKPHRGIIETFDDIKLKKGQVLVPGCGTGYDAFFLAERGFDVIAFDFSTNVIKKARSKLKSKGKIKGNLKFEVEDIYHLPDSYNNKFDYVVEIANFQAMSVKERRDYVRVIAEVLKPRGKCVVLCKKYPPLTPGPKGIKKSSLKKYFSAVFVIEDIKPVLMYRNSDPADGFRLIVKKK